MKKTKKKQKPKEKVASSPLMKAVRNIVLILLVAAIGFTLYTYRGEITTDNLRQFFAGIRLFGNDTQEEVPIQFASSSQNRFTVFKNGAVLADGEKLTLFSPQGGKQLELELPLSAPMLFASEKYVFAFSLGDTSLFVVDSLDINRTVESDLPIYGGAYDSKGGLVLVNENASGQASCVTLYDARFRRLWRQTFANRFVSGADVNARGDCAVAAYGVENGDYTSQLLCFSAKGESLFSVDLPGMLVLRLEFLSGGRLLVLGDHSALILEADTGKEVARAEYGTYTVKSVRSSQQGVAITLELGNMAGRGRVICIDGNGTVAADLVLNSTPLDTLWNGNEVYVLGLGVCQAYEKDGTRLDDIKTAADATALLPVNRQTFYIIHVNFAEKIVSQG